MLYSAQGALKTGTANLGKWYTAKYMPGTHAEHKWAALANDINTRKAVYGLSGVTSNGIQLGTNHGNRTKNWAQLWLDLAGATGATNYLQKIPRVGKLLDGLFDAAGVFGAGWDLYDGAKDVINGTVITPMDPTKNE